MVRMLLVCGLLVSWLGLTTPPVAALGDIDLPVIATPYYGGEYVVGLRATWGAVPGAATYRVSHYRRDACGEETVTVTTTRTTAASGGHRNCGAPDQCYYKQVNVVALDTNGAILAVGTDSICVVGLAV